MLVAVQGFGSIWTERGVSGYVDGATPARRRAFYNTTGVMARNKLRSRSCIYGHVRLDECSGFHPRSADRSIHRVYESEGLSVLEWTEQTLPPTIDAGRYASRCVPVPRRLSRDRMDRPERIMEMQWRASGFVQRRERATGSPAHLAGLWMGP